MVRLRSSRRALLRRQKPVPKKKNPLVWIKANRKKAIAVGVGGALLLGGLRYHADLPYLVGAKKQYHLGLLFSPHQNRADIATVEKILATAREKGKPYHIMLVEASGLRKEEMQSSIKEWNKRATLMRNDFENLARQGVRGEDAMQRLRGHYGKYMPQGFALDICLLLAREGVRIAPAERYDAETIKRLKILDSEATAKDKLLSSALASNAPMAQLQVGFDAANKCFRKLADVREGPTIDAMKETIRDARKLFPDLKNEREIRVFSQFGTFHRDKMTPEVFNTRSLEAHEVFPQARYSIRNFAALQRNKNAAFGEFEARMQVLDYYLGEVVQTMPVGDPKRGIPKNPEYAKRIFEGVTKVTQQEFEQLSERTKKMSYVDRVNFLINYLLGK